MPITYTLGDIIRQELVISDYTKKPVKSLTTLRHIVKMNGFKPQFKQNGSVFYALTKSDIKKINKSLIQ